MLQLAFLREKKATRNSHGRNSHWDNKVYKILHGLEQNTGESGGVEGVYEGGAAITPYGADRVPRVQVEQHEGGGAILVFRVVSRCLHFRHGVVVVVDVTVEAS